MPTAEFCEIVPGRLVLGSSAIAVDLPLLRKLGVRRVVNCSPQTVKTTGPSFYGADRMGYMELWQDDMTDYSILRDFEAVWAFASQKDGAVLIHCEKGVNRSAAIAIAYHLRLSEQEPHSRSLSPEARFMSSWRGIAEKKGKVLTNTGFQRQLLLFARLCNNWDPSLDHACRTPKERQLALFRTLSEKVAWAIIGPDSYIPADQKWRIIVSIRDGTTRAEQRMAKDHGVEAFSGNERTWMRRIRKYTQRKRNDATAAQDKMIMGTGMQQPPPKRQRR